MQQCRKREVIAIADRGASIGNQQKKKFDCRPSPHVAVPVQTHIRDRAVKYIIVEGPDGEAPVLFPRAFMHKWVAEQLKPLESVAAGFVRSAEGRLQCYGVSESLRIGSRPERDSALINHALGAQETDPA